MVMQCLDCGVATTKAICAKCLATRKPCANKNCSAKLNPKNDYVYCKSCACSVLTCRNPHRLNTKLCEVHNFCKTTGCDNQRPSSFEDYCKTCQEDWNSSAPKCVVCRKKKREIESVLCLGCTNLLSTCGKCKTKRVHVKPDGTKLSFCKTCLCQQPKCNNGVATIGGKYCQKCIDSCGICNKQGALGLCPRLKQAKSDETCTHCCFQPKCTRERARDEDGNYFDMCTTCHWNWNYNDESVLCDADNCFVYTKTSFCSTCSKKENARTSTAKPTTQSEATQACKTVAKTIPTTVAQPAIPHAETTVAAQCDPTPKIAVANLVDMKVPQLLSPATMPMVNSIVDMAMLPAKDTEKPKNASTTVEQETDISVLPDVVVTCKDSVVVTRPKHNKGHVIVIFK